jgi:membrane associated rhomboid family serine protease
MAPYRSNQGFMPSVPIVTKNLIILNGLMWVSALVLRRVNVDLVDILGLHYVGSENFFPTQLVTYLFMHDTSGIGHIFFNMFAVFVFGRILEQVWGPSRFLVFYLVTGIGAGLVQELVWYLNLRPVLEAINTYLITDDPAALSSYFNVTEGIHYSAQSIATAKEVLLNNMVTIGASGAVFGVLLGFGMLFPNAPLYIMFIPIPIKAKYLVIGYGLIEFFAGISNLSGDNVAHFAHLGGMLFGFFLIRFWKKKGVGNGFFLG